MPIDIEKLKTLAQAAKAAESAPASEPRQIVDELIFYSAPEADFVASTPPSVVLELIAELEAARAVLRQVEWVAGYYDPPSQVRCPLCVCYKPVHSPKCALARAIGKP